MILVDTSVWVEHFRKGTGDLVDALNSSQVCCHDFVIGELACGSLKNREMILRLLSALPRLPARKHGQVLYLMEEARLFGKGLGWVDLHLLASARSANVTFWTLDKRLKAAARRLDLVA